jgi:predicted metal-dependent hydrolase
MRDPVTATARRHVPDEPFPPYSFVPGQFPHPTRDPRGHACGRTPERPAPPNPNRWNECRAYLYGIDLFNYGYYWEAHEAWESLWHACGCTGLTADFLRALIRLAAAAVKARDGTHIGMKSHAAAARTLFQETAAHLGGDHHRYMGLSLSDLCQFAAEVAEGQVHEVAPGTRVAVIFAFTLQPV